MAMNLFEKFFFSVFLLFSGWKGEEDITGINALLVFGLVLFFNVLTIVVSSFALGINFELINYLDSKFKWLLFTVSWFSILGLLFLRKNQIIKYRERLRELDVIKSRKIKNAALIYCIVSILLGVITAYIVNYIVNA